MKWTAIVPLKPPGQRKSRLAARLSAAERDALAERLAAHVASCLSAEPRISRIVQLSETRTSNWSFAWSRDEGRGLSAELDVLRAKFAPHGLLVIHGDLPLLRADDVAAMLDAAEAGAVALAPDRHGVGTNAVALAASSSFHFAFGENSFARHLQQGCAARIVRTLGLALDLDTPADFDAVLAAGGALGLLAPQPPLSRSLGVRPDAQSPPARRRTDKSV